MRPSINESEQESGENVIMQNMFSAECRGFSLFFFLKKCCGRMCVWLYVVVFAYVVDDYFVFAT